MKNNKVQKMVAVSLFAAMGLVLQFISFPIIPMISFMKVDFGDIPVLLSMFLFGPTAGVLTAFIRSFLHLATTGIGDPANMIGDATNFLATMTFVFPIYYFFQVRARQSRFNKAYGIVTSMLVMATFMSVANYFVITPVYLALFGMSATQFFGMSLVKYIVIGVLPFNIIKSLMVGGVFLVLYAKLLPWLSKKQVGTIHYQSVSK